MASEEHVKRLFTLQRRRTTIVGGNERVRVAAHGFTPRLPHQPVVTWKRVCQFNP